MRQNHRKDPDMANMISTKNKPVQVLPSLEDVARARRYAIENEIYNTRGEPNVGGVIDELFSREIRRRYPELTSEEYLWCAQEQAKNEAARARRGKMSSSRKSTK